MINIPIEKRREYLKKIYSALNASPIMYKYTPEKIKDIAITSEYECCENSQTELEYHTGIMQMVQKIISTNHKGAGSTKGAEAIPKKLSAAAPKVFFSNTHHKTGAFNPMPDAVLRGGPPVAHPDFVAGNALPSRITGYGVGEVLTHDRNPRFFPANYTQKYDAMRSLAPTQTRAEPMPERAVEKLMHARRPDEYMYMPHKTPPAPKCTVLQSIPKPEKRIDTYHPPYLGKGPTYTYNAEQESHRMGKEHHPRKQIFQNIHFSRKGVPESFSDAVPQMHRLGPALDAPRELYTPRPPVDLARFYESTAKVEIETRPPEKSYRRKAEFPTPAAFDHQILDFSLSDATEVVLSDDERDKIARRFDTFSSELVQAELDLREHVKLDVSNDVNRILDASCKVVRAQMATFPAKKYFLKMASVDMLIEKIRRCTLGVRRDLLKAQKGLESFDFPAICARVAKEFRKRKDADPGFVLHLET